MNRAPGFLVSDLSLSRRLERAEGSASAAFVEARAAQTPALRAQWQAVEGTYAMYDGVDSPLTQTFGLGLFAPATTGQLETLEAFFQSRGAAVCHEVSPLADTALLSLLPSRGYAPVEMTTVMFLPLATLASEAPAARPEPALRTRIIAPEEGTAWAESAALGWSESPELSAFMLEYGLVTSRSRGLTCFVAELDGAIIATGALAVHDGVALLAGASTIPAWRRRGAQSALLAARLAHARALGCDLAMIGASPGSTSQANAERQGFRIAYTRTKWRLP